MSKKVIYPGEIEEILVVIFDQYYNKTDLQGKYPELDRAVDRLFEICADKVDARKRRWEYQEKNYGVTP